MVKQKEDGGLEALRQRALKGEVLGSCPDLFIVSGNIPVELSPTGDESALDVGDPFGLPDTAYSEDQGKRYRRRISGRSSGSRARAIF